MCNSDNIKCHSNKDKVDNLVPIGFDSENLTHPCC